MDRKYMFVANVHHYPSDDMDAREFFYVTDKLDEDLRKLEIETKRETKK